MCEIVLVGMPLEKFQYVLDVLESRREWVLRGEAVFNVEDQEGAIITCDTVKKVIVDAMRLDAEAPAAEVDDDWSRTGDFYSTVLIDNYLALAFSRIDCYDPLGMGWCAYWQWVVPFDQFAVSAKVHAGQTPPAKRFWGLACHGKSDGGDMR